MICISLAQPELFTLVEMQSTLQMYTGFNAPTQLFVALQQIPYTKRGAFQKRQKCSVLAHCGVQLCPHFILNTKCPRSTNFYQFAISISYKSTAEARQVVHAIFSARHSLLSFSAHFIIFYYIESALRNPHLKSTCKA